MQFVGCGDAFGSGGRFNTCFHLRGASTNLLIDCGASSLIAMKQLGIDRNAIDAIVVTHFHADHFGGIPFFILDAQFFSRRDRPLIIAGPTGLEHWYERVMETAFPGSAAARRKFAVELVPIAPGASAVIAGARVSGFQAQHGGTDGPFLALRVEAEGRVIAYTGDSEWAEGLVEASRGSDLLIAEAYFRDRPVATHLNLASIEAGLEQLDTRRLVLTHMSDDMLHHPDRAGFECAEDGLVLHIA